MRRLIIAAIVMVMAIPISAFALSQGEIESQIKDLQKQVDKLNKDNVKLEKKVKRASKKSPIAISGDYQFRLDAMKGTVPTYYQFIPSSPPANITGYDVENSNLWTNRFGLNIQARATEDIKVKARLLMYKAWGHQTAGPVLGNFFADRSMVFDGNTSHIPQDSVLRVDQAFASWSGIGGAPVWFSIGRRPSTGGVPTNIRRNLSKSGASGTPGLLVDYAFDGLVLGAAPDIESMPGAYAKFCYGRGFDSGFQREDDPLNDVSMVGLDMVFYDTEKFHVEAQYNRGMDFFAFPEANSNPAYGGTNQNLGSIDEFGAVVMGKAGDLNWFAAGGLSKTHPNDNLVMSMAGLLYDAGNKQSQAGHAFYVGGRYDMDHLGLKLGAEYNKGSQYWMTFTPAADDLITSKLGTRGDVVEVYVIKELQQKRISRKGRAFFRLGYQAYDFDYTGSNNWVGAPKKVADLDNMANTQLMTPLEDASDLYLTFNVEF